MWLKNASESWQWLQELNSYRKTWITGGLDGFGVQERCMWHLKLFSVMKVWETWYYTELYMSCNSCLYQLKCWLHGWKQVAICETYVMLEVFICTWIYQNLPFHPVSMPKNSHYTFKIPEKALEPISEHLHFLNYENNVLFPRHPGVAKQFTQELSEGDSSHFIIN